MSVKLNLNTLRRLLGGVPSVPVQDCRPHPTVAFDAGGALFCKLAVEKNVNGDVFVRLPEQKARILQSPLNVRDDKMSLGRCGSTFKMDKNRNGDLVRRAEECEDTCCLDGRVP